MLPDPPVTTVPRRRLADDLRAAIEGGEVELRYQPQVAMADGRITGVEVLARWQHPRLGELGAEKLFAAANRAHLGAALSQHIQRAALAAVAAWPPALAGLDVALNVTGDDLARPDFADDLLQRLRNLHVDPSRLTLEVTEHEPIADLTAAASVLAVLRAAGARVALDDFGTGYSTIAWLRALPLDYLKLDAGLSRDLLGDARQQVVVRHLIAMARELGLGVIAEGVEEETHRALLAAAGATHCQGFLCAGPVGEQALAEFVASKAVVV